ncbi:alkylphosphonate utilization protein [Pleionea sp. CnH1-48]|uniref:PhnA domain-containing protein n=1 Tax=Pleionea sp. CnH1-48 TaxID=2954494 RepID=UPI002096FB4A|nr:alkylphosphonate utilization protein [Pleionea sp. CnH1-48]MCO7223578.1 PhnA domain-containing protein [Pleionea sp. CnH1-48]
MNIKDTLLQRSHGQCELCTAKTELSVYEIPPATDPDSDKCVLLCDSCKTQIEKTAEINVNHWRCLNDSMWSQTPAVQVMAWRMLNRLSTESWAQDLLDMLYLEEDVKAWAESEVDDDTTPTLDSNGALLSAGDSVTLIKDLDVKGTGFTAKRGTAVRNISLTSNPEHIEGRVNGVRIVILTKYVKKS